MTAKTELLLYQLLWVSEQVFRPTWRNLVEESFEAWAYRSGLLRQISRLEHQALVESSAGSQPDSRMYRLTEAGCLHALGGRNPIACWERPWDGIWRMAIFDVPENRHTSRDRLRRHFKDSCFGLLQRSVWISPHPMEEQRRLLGDAPIDVGSLILMEGRPCTGETDQQIVAKAWNFDEINGRYEAHKKVLARCPARPFETHAAMESFHRWLNEERESWALIMRCDPLLPNVLLPLGYIGRETWELRLKVMKKAGKAMRDYECSRNH